MSEEKRIFRKTLSMEMSVFFRSNCRSPFDEEEFFEEFDQN